MYGLPKNYNFNSHMSLCMHTWQGGGKKRGGCTERQCVHYLALG